MSEEELVETIFQKNLKIKKLKKVIDNICKDYNIDDKKKKEYYNKVGIL